MLQDSISLKKKEWAERNPGSSTFGAPVFFKNQSSVSDNTKAASQKKAIPKKHADQSDHVQKNNQKLPPKTKRKAAPELLKQQTKEYEIKKMANSPIQTVQYDQKIPTDIYKHLPQAKKMITLADIARGFLAQQGTGTDSGLRMKGVKKQPPGEQIKYERYAQKINWCVQNSFNIHRRKLILSRAVRATIKVLLELNQNGIIHDVQLVYASGLPELDEFIIFLFKDAGKSFPPLPKFLGKKAQNMDYTIRIDTGPVTGSNLAMTLI